MHGLHPRRRQQRLFTGALFPETLNDQLAAFARRHKLQSEVWVPRRAFDLALKPYGVYILPNATLCDATLTPGDGIGWVTASIGVDRCLVNAAQTSNQYLLEGFADFLVWCPPPLQQVSAPTQAPSFAASSIAGAQAACDASVALPSSPCRAKKMNTDEFLVAAVDGDAEHTSMRAATAGSRTASILSPDPAWDNIAPFQHPLAINGSLLHATSVTDLARMQQKGQRWPTYWRCVNAAGPGRQRFFSMGDSECPGRYNPHFCVQYTPHTYTNLSFPSPIAVLMRHRAVEHKYVSRLWVTLKQAEELFGTRLLPERANDAPVVYCNYFTAGWEATAFYCADQFAGASVVFPNPLQLDMAVKGVRLPSMQLRAYPLLARLTTQFTKEEASDGGIEDRIGSDQAMSDAGRHTEFVEHRKRCAAIELHGFRTSKAAQLYLKSSKIAGTLTRQCLLCDYPRPLFFSHRALASFDLALREGEQGVVQTRLPVRLNNGMAWCSGECWFNVSQLREPAVGQELMDNPPRHFLTRQLLHGVVAVNCCRAQLARRGGTGATTASSTPTVPARCDFSAEWVPAYVLEKTGWRLRKGAQGVVFVPLPAATTLKRLPVGPGIFFSIEDVDLGDAVKDWLRRYTPISETGAPFLRGLRQAMTLHAFERGYRAHRWLLYRTRHSGPFSEPLQSLLPSCKPAHQLHSQALPGAPLSAYGRIVKMGSFEFVSQEEVASVREARVFNGSAVSEGGDVEPDAPLFQMSMAERSRVELGIGLSAESLLLGREGEMDDPATGDDTATSRSFDAAELAKCGGAAHVFDNDDVALHMGED
ncbi:hypothetical protein LSCM1_03102 [Leishmania martiniquensis]|uniref:Trypanosoma Tc-38 (p38) protein domain-containing protein n=1 Tax=Leishmania martiniquensis TaxID=1580590 RepID=A0A836KIQ1_9TRYP|nr:hypothetical protein LSCM1_03102 [Leishmania martiniquensis]